MQNDKYASANAELNALIEKYKTFEVELNDARGSMDVMTMEAAKRHLLPVGTMIRCATYGNGMLDGSLRTITGHRFATDRELCGYAFFEYELSPPVGNPPGSYGGTQSSVAFDGDFDVINTKGEP